MKNSGSIIYTLSTRKIFVSFLLAFLTFSLHAYNLRQLSSREGLSNSAILSVCQDSERFMWIGTVDGLNVYDGVDINIFKPDMNTPGSLSGNLIEEVREGEEGIIWINTNHGLNRYDKITRKIESFDEFEGKYYLAQTVNNHIFAIHEDKTIDYYDKNSKKFIPIYYPDIIKSDIQRVFIDQTNVLWIITNKGIIHNAQILFDSGFPVITPSKDFAHDCEIRYAFMDNDRIYIVDNEGFFFEIDAISQKKSLVLNLKNELEERGIVSAIIKDKDDYLVAFQTNGLIRLQNTPENLIKYEVKNIDIYCGVFCLYKDEKQDVIWIGTDGQGIYMYTHDQFSIRSVTFERLPYSIQKPVRAIYWDQEQNLWIGTKDDGILFVRDYHVNDDINTKKIDHFTTSNSLLTNNSVYAFGQSRRNLLWIGGDGPGLNYYSYKQKAVMKLTSPPGAEPLLFIHAICEVDDSTLWLASVGAGIYKVIVGGTVDGPVIRSVKRFTFEKDEMSYNYFFTACQENDSIVWFGNRGYGLRRLNLRSETFDKVKFHKKDIRTINDILSMYKDRKGNVWVGTSFGVLKLQGYDTESHEVSFANYNEIEGLPNNTIHGILEDDRGYLWISTNGGVVQFDTKAESFHVYNHRNGLNVFEFSDGAYMKDRETGALFFGGTNGFVTISPDVHVKKEFIPQVYFTGLKIYEGRYNLNDYIHSENDRRYLRLRYDQNFFSLSFIALDYIDGQNCKYYYNLENFNTKWIENGYSNVVNFTNISPGEYTLHVKCTNGNVMTETRSLVIVILPPWYMTGWAYAVYILLFLSLVYFSVGLVRKRYKRKRETIIEKMHQQQKEEIYESKLRFFTNITHEFSTPLTLIYGPCDRIISYEKSDTFVRKYAGMILKNAERLNSLIQELIEFRRIETGHKSCLIQRLDITDLSGGIVDSFTELAESRNIQCHSEIEEGLLWNTDERCFTKILTNLLSNAFKYTPDGGKIDLFVRLLSGRLDVLVSNTGKGIRKEDIPFVFDRYRVLENFEKQTQKGYFSRNGLGLAICYNMVKLLDGEIDVRSVPDAFTEFQVTFPAREVTDTGDTADREGALQIPSDFAGPAPDVNKEGNFREWAKLTVLVVDDDPEMCAFTAEILSKQYHVIPVEKPLSVFKVLETVQPELIISDIMMPELDGLSLMKQIKADRRTAHIPFVLLSAKNTPEDQTEGISAGAEAYVVKPFNVEYLLSVVERLLQRQNDLKDYYRSAISSYEFTDGKFIHKESKDFYERVMTAIDRNLGNSDFSTEQLARELGLSPRHLYRKLKDITDETPANLIKEYRLSVVEKLLLTSQNTVDEIMYKAGFNNRGSFYRLFSQRFGMTPKKYRETKTETDLKPH